MLFSSRVRVRIRVSIRIMIRVGIRFGVVLVSFYATYLCDFSL